MTAFIWALLGIILIGAEFLIPGVFIIFFGLGSLTTAVLSLIIPGFAQSLVLQLLSLSFTSVLSILFFRKKFASIFRGKLISGPSDKEIGGKAIVIETVSNEKPGRVKYQGTTWKAITYDDEALTENEEVEILGVENLTYIITKSIFN